MGNTSSTNSTTNAEKKFDNFYDIIDYIATYYILTSDFKSLSKLSEKEYCDKLVILTSDIIQRYFNDMEIEYLAQRVKNGVVVNELEKDNIIFLNKDELDSLDVSNDVQKSIRKKRVCIGIAKFYVKIAHIFSAIVMTINPIYTYQGPDGQTIKTPFMEKDTIPKNTKRKLYKMNICDNRIRALKKGEIVNQETGDINIQPKVCDMNVNKEGQLKHLSDEPGITELMQLYLDDNYDYSTGVFTGMSENTKTQYMNDLKTFYTAFTGNDTMPPDITKFSDILLRDYNTQKGCQGENPAFKNAYTINKKDDLFVKYADNINQMIQTAANNQSKLISVINDLFTYVVDPFTKKRRIRVNPKLNDELLQNCVVKTRKLIIDLYVKCETDYVNGVKIYEAIVEKKILETTQNQIQNLTKKSNQILNESEEKIKSVIKPTAPAVQVPDENNSEIPLASAPAPSNEISSEPPIVPQNEIASNPVLEPPVAPTKELSPPNEQPMPQIK